MSPDPIQEGVDLAEHKRRRDRLKAFNEDRRRARREKAERAQRAEVKRRMKGIAGA